MLIVKDYDPIIIKKPYLDIKLKKFQKPKLLAHEKHNPHELLKI